MTLFATYDPTSLFAGEPPVRHRSVTLAGSQNSSGTPLPRGTVLGRAAVGGATVAAKSGGNTGSGAFTIDGTTPVLANAKPGIYTVRCIAAASNSGTFRVTDPNGNVLGDVAVAATFADQIKFSIADGSPDFIVGDGFDVTVAAGDSYVVSVATAKDGSQIPTGVLAFDTDTSGGAIAAPVYFEGEFAAEKTNFDASWSIATLQAATRQNGIPLYIRSVGSLG